MSRQQTCTLSLRSIDVGNLPLGPFPVSNLTYPINPSLYAKSITAARFRMYNLVPNILPQDLLPSDTSGGLVGNGNPAQGNVFTVSSGASIVIPQGNYSSGTDADLTYGGGPITLAYALAHPTQGIGDIRFTLLRLFNASVAGSLVSVSVNPTTFVMTLVWAVPETTVVVPPSLGFIFNAGGTWVGNRAVNLGYPMEFYVVINTFETLDRYIIGTTDGSYSIYAQTVLNVPVEVPYGDIIVYEPQNLLEQTVRQSSVSGQSVFTYINVMLLDQWGNLLPLPSNANYDLILYLKSSKENS